MRKLLWSAVIIAALAAAGWWARPALEQMLWTARLLREPPAAALPLPIDGLKLAAIEDTWGAARPGGRRHEGVELFARRGTPVRSTTHGLIWRLGENPLGGTVVWVLGPGGDLHYYAHLDRIADLTLRQRVQAGTVIGYVGNSGNAARTPPHLHYGIYRRGSAINPFPLLMAPG